MIRIMGLALIVLGAALPAAAQTEPEAGHGHHGTAMPMPHAAPWAEINARMHEGMAVEPSGDVDTDFVRQMLAHHQGALEMAEYVLEHGSDPIVRSLAANIIATQNSEMMMMRAWLAQHEGE